MSYFTTFRDEDVATTFTTPYGEEPTLYCPNDECPAIEVVPDPFYPEEVGEVIRLAWGSGYVRSTRVDQGYHAHEACPECGAPGRGIDELL